MSYFDFEGFNKLGYLKSADLSNLNKLVGVYAHFDDSTGELLYIGKACERLNGGLRKRLSDYRRNSDSARGYRSGRLIHDSLDNIVTYYKITGSDENAVLEAKHLEEELISRYNPPFNSKGKKK